MEMGSAFLGLAGADYHQCYRERVWGFSVPARLGEGGRGGRVPFRWSSDRPALPSTAGRWRRAPPPPPRPSACGAHAQPAHMLGGHSSLRSRDFFFFFGTNGGSTTSACVWSRLPETSAPGLRPSV